MLSCTAQEEKAGAKFKGRKPGGVTTNRYMVRTRGAPPPPPSPVPLPTGPLLTLLLLLLLLLLLQARLKNFTMLRKSSAVQGKLKASLKAQHNSLKRRLAGSSGSKLRKVSKKTANRRRRT
jgi:hypothetical protein